MRMGKQTHPAWNFNGELMICSRCPNEVHKRMRGLCTKCYYKEYDSSPARVAYKKEYADTDEYRLKYRLYSKTESFKRSNLKYTKTEKFKKMQKKYRLSNKARYSMSIRASVRRNKSWEITFEQYEILMKSCCHYCLGPLSPFGTNLDRKDNELGYIISNVVTCCGDCNRTKGDRITYGEMVEVSKLLNFLRKNKI